MQLKTTLYGWAAPYLLPGRKKSCCRSTRWHTLSWISPLLGFLRCFAWCFSRLVASCLLTRLPDHRKKAERCLARRWVTAWLPLARAADTCGVRPQQLVAGWAHARVQQRCIPRAAELLLALGEGCQGWTWSSLTEKGFNPNFYMIPLLWVLSVEFIFTNNAECFSNLLKVVAEEWQNSRRGSPRHGCSMGWVARGAGASPNTPCFPGGPGTPTALKLECSVALKLTHQAWATEGCVGWKRGILSHRLPIWWFALLPFSFSVPPHSVHVSWVTQGCFFHEFRYR